MFGFKKKGYKGMATAVPAPEKATGDSADGVASWDDAAVGVEEYGAKVLRETYPSTLPPHNYPIFMGYNTLSAIALRPEMRIACEDSVSEVFRRGFEIKARKSQRDLSEVIATLSEDMKRFKVEEFMQVAGLDAEQFGICHVLVRLKNDDSELSKELLLDPTKIKKGDLVGFTTIDPVWVTPIDYNVSNPLALNFYKPNTWIVAGKEAEAATSKDYGYGVSATRIKQIVLYRVPDIYKPDFFFGGLSLTQQMLPYVDNFESVRDDIPKVIQTFRTQVWKTDMDSILKNSGVFKERLEAFAYGRDNHGVLAVDKDTEDLTQINTSLSGLVELQRELLKLICVPSRLAVTTFTGEQDGGLNSTAQGERDAQHEHIASKQKRGYAPMLNWILKILCLNAFGEVYEELYIDFNPLEEMNKKELAEVNYRNAQTYSEYLDRQVITPEQVHSVLSNDEQSPFTGTKYEAEIDLSAEGVDEGSIPSGEGENEVS